MWDLRVFATPRDLAEGAAREVVRILEDAVSRRGICSLVLAGGSSPRGLYEALSDEPWTLQNGSNVHLFWGDERCVPPDDPDSNYRMVRETLLSRVAIPDDSVHRIDGELEPSQAARDYAAELDRFSGDAVPRFDLVILGLGADGHTASLFPDTPHLRDEERLVVPTVAPQPPRHRVTLSLRVLNAARVVMFLAMGLQKARIMSEVIGPARDESSSRLPAAAVEPEDGLLLWFVDRAAADELPDWKNPYTSS